MVTQKRVEAGIGELTPVILATQEAESGRIMSLRPVPGEKIA
jgi:hypothetical protein